MPYGDSTVDGGGTERGGGDSFMGDKRASSSGIS